MPSAIRQGFCTAAAAPLQSVDNSSSGVMTFANVKHTEQRLLDDFRALGPWALRGMGAGGAAGASGTAWLAHPSRAPPAGCSGGVCCAVSMAHAGSSSGIAASIGGLPLPPAASSAASAAAASAEHLLPPPCHQLPGHPNQMDPGGRSVVRRRASAKACAHGSSGSSGCKAAAAAWAAGAVCAVAASPGSLTAGPLTAAITTGSLAVPAPAAGVPAADVAAARRKASLPAFVTRSRKRSRSTVAVSDCGRLQDCGGRKGAHRPASPVLPRPIAAPPADEGAVVACATDAADAESPAFKSFPAAYFSAARAAATVVTTPATNAPPSSPSFEACMGLCSSAFKAFGMTQSAHMLFSGS